MIQWQVFTFDQLSNQQLYDLLKLRVNVFVVEQNCPYPELDDKDTLKGVYHLIGLIDGEIVACVRLLPKGVSYDNVSIGRVATKGSARGNGLGHALMTQALKYCQEIWPEQSIEIGAQQYLKAFYELYGFKPTSQTYLEDGIPHIDMRLEKR